MQAGGRVNFQGVTHAVSSAPALNVNMSDQVAGMPAWADSEQFDVMAKAPSDDPSSPSLDRDTVAPMLRALLVDRFKMTYHTEDRQVAAYTLVSAKPKMKKADPASRTSCKGAQGPAGTPPGTLILNCQNITMAQFADRMQAHGARN
ncbi:MAG: TIGR03435 family protein [Ignavibacteriota bacterium]